MKTKHSKTLTLAFALITGSALLAGAQNKKPNVLVIWGDDIGT
jgi:hypothetical protein